MKSIDLHVHSTASDGSYTPSALVDLAIKKNLQAFALTDHDTCDGISEAVLYADKLDNPVTVIPGIELSAEYLDEDVHILGLNINPQHPEFLAELTKFQNARSDRNAKMIKRMREQGFDITEEMVLRRFGDAVITRAHYAILMVELGFVPDRTTAFEKYLDKGAPCYIPRYKITPFDAVKLIQLAGGHPVMAHPVLYHFEETVLETLISDLAQTGLEGLEAIYSCGTKEEEQKYRSLAEKYHLYITGGSDFHGTAKPGLEMGTGYGNLSVPAELLKNIL